MHNGEEHPTVNRISEPRPRPFVVVGTPSLYADVCFPYLQSAIETVAAFSQHGIDWGFILSPGDPYLAKVRNNIATRFLTEYPQGTHLFFIDADLGWPAEAAVRMVQRDWDVVAGVYPKKSDPPEFPCELFLDDPKDGKLIEREGWYKANAVPTGFLCLKRHVLEQMAVGKGTYRDLDGKEKYNIFQMGYHAGDNMWWGEDYAFCRQWREAGGELWVWPDIQFAHTGKKSWANNFAPSVRAFIDGRATIRDIEPRPNEGAVVGASAVQAPSEDMGGPRPAP